MFSILRVLFGTKRSDKQSEIRERADSRRIATTLQKHDKFSPASRHQFQNLWLIETQRMKWKPG